MCHLPIFHVVEKGGFITRRIIPGWVCHWHELTLFNCLLTVCYDVRTHHMPIFLMQRNRGVISASSVVYENIDVLHTPSYLNLPAKSSSCTCTTTKFWEVVYKQNFDIATEMVEVEGAEISLWVSLYKKYWQLNVVCVHM